MGIFENALERHLSKEDMYHRSRVCKFLASKTSIDRLLDNLEKPLPENLSDVYGWRHSYLPREYRSRWNSNGGNNLNVTLCDKRSDTFSDDSGYCRRSCGASHASNTKVTPVSSASSSSHPLGIDAKTKLLRPTHKDMSFVLSTDSGFSTSSDTDSPSKLEPVASKTSKRSSRRNRKESGASPTRKVSFSQHMSVHCKLKNSGNDEVQLKGESRISKRIVSLPFQCSDYLQEDYLPGRSTLAEIRHDPKLYIDQRSRRERDNVTEELETKYRFPAVNKAIRATVKGKDKSDKPTSSSQSKRRVDPDRAEAPQSRKVQRKFVTSADKENSDKRSPFRTFDAFTKADKQFLPLEPTFPKKFTDDPAEFRKISSQEMEVILHFEPAKDERNADEFPFNIVVEETSIRGHISNYVQSLSAAVKSCSQERLEIHGLLPWNDTQETLKFILVIFPNISPGGRTVTYKGTYRRQMKPDAQFMTWRFLL